MSTQGAVPPATARRPALTTALVAAAMVVAAIGGYAVGTRSTAVREVMTAAPPAAQRIAIVTEARCAGQEPGVCQTLWLGAARENAEPVATLAAGSERVDGIAWAADGYRVGFLVNGYQLRVFNSDSRQPVARIDLVEPSGTPSARIARGVTFSENGQAVTFDDCPRVQSGCRPGFAGIR